MLRESSLWARLPLLLGLSALTYLTYAILSPFLIPVAWAAILAFVTWPLRTRLLSLFGGRVNLTAAVMTFILAATLIGPLAWLLVVLGVLTPAIRSSIAWKKPVPDTVPSLSVRTTRINTLLPGRLMATLRFSPTSTCIRVWSPL